ncbi:MAG: divalent metal cation transporter [Candidatus Dormibacteraeota bacterium]|uniref:Divalent metal cation transporter n=1 Tax=Candidatus Dormiibacter inghamiae TaxID=3127013 RepID=A0A934NE53_9BACT|nr:divalent metal cation transporter [Candidatus Dormibacteraeota bacterium]MBJ7606270.1 divalent metal cation transporter [Candidatus Dormibacteraeota bacterium]
MADRIQDPVLERLSVGADAEPALLEVLKGDTDHKEPGTGTPLAARSTFEDAKKRGPLGVLQLLGPGLITGASDDDPSGIGTYSQVGSQFGFGMLWLAPFTFPMMAAVQEVCGRIALQTGVGLGTSLRKKFPTALVGVCIAALLIANTINVGADLGAVASGASQLTRQRVPEILFVVPVAALVAVLQLFVSFQWIFRVFKWLTLSLFAYIVTGFAAHPDLLQVVKATVIPHLELSQNFVMGVVAVLGTTISPYLFFWQASAEVDEMSSAEPTTEVRRSRLKTSELRAARTDIFIGMAFSQIVMYFIILTSGAVLHAHGKTDIQSADQAASALEPFLGSFAFVAFALGMIGTGLLAIPILSGSAAYALKEFMGWRGSLAVKPQYRPTFYGIMVAAVVAGALMNFLHIDPIKALFYTAVLNGLVAPPLLVLITLLGADRKYMKRHLSGQLSQALCWAATAAMGAAAIALIVTLIPGVKLPGG